MNEQPVPERDNAYALQQPQTQQQQQTQELELMWPWDPESEDEDDDELLIHRYFQATTEASVANPAAPLFSGMQREPYIPPVSYRFQHEQQSKCQQLLDIIQSGSPSDRMAALTVLKQDSNTLSCFLARTKAIHELVDVLASDSLEQQATCDLVQLNPSSEADQLDWKGAVWELLMLILYNLKDLNLDIQAIREPILVSVLALVEQQKEAAHRCMALQFLLAEPLRCTEHQAFIVDNGGLSLLVNVLAIERDTEASQLLLELLHQLAAAGTSYEQEIHLTVQGIVDSHDDQRTIEYGNLLLLVNQVQVPAFAPSATDADRKEQIGQLVLQAATNTLYLASSSVLHKSIALNCVRQALPEIGFAFVFDFEGIPLLWDLLMQSADAAVKSLTVDILRLLAHEDDALRDHILEFYSQYTSVQDAETNLRAASIRREIFGERSAAREKRIAHTDEIISDSHCYGRGLDTEISVPASDCAEKMVRGLSTQHTASSSGNIATRSDDDWELISGGEC